MTSLLWRGPLAAAAAWLAWRWLPRWRWMPAALAAVVLAGEAVLPAAVRPAAAADAMGRTVAAVAHTLEGVAQEEAVAELLSPGGGEVDPEAPFALLDRVARGLSVEADALLLVDERARPVAWNGSSARLPVRLWPLGAPAVVSEPGYRAVWVWWRRPVFVEGRQLGALLAGVSLPESGSRRVLGVAAGRAAVLVPVIASGTPVPGPAGVTVVGIDVQRAPAVWWSAPGFAAPVAVLALAAVGAAPVFLVAAATVAVAALGGWLSLPWWLLLALAVTGLWLGRWPVRWWSRLVGAGLVASVGASLPGILVELGLDPAPSDLLQPGLFRLTLAVSVTWLVRNAPRPSAPALGWPIQAACWLPLIAGLLLLNPWLAAAGAVALTLWGLAGRQTVAAALVASVLLLTGGGAAGRRELVAATETTLARLAGAGAPARAVLASLPESALDQLGRLSPRETLVVLGRLADWLDFAGALPGASLALESPPGEVIASWGETALPPAAPDRELASRDLASGARLAVRVPPAPYDVLAALDAGGVDVPVAALDRSGAARGRGATFRPASPDVVGRALAAERSWGRVGVGEREFAAYLRAWGDTVLAVPWVRPPAPEQALILAALALWGALPFLLHAERRRWLEWWAERRTFAGRVRVLVLASTLLPLLLLGYLLSRQWAMQQERGRLQVGRAIAGPMATDGWAGNLGWLVRDMGAVVAVYQSGEMVRCTRPDLALAGEVPFVAPRTAYVRSVRAWREPLVTGDERVNVFTALPGGAEPVLVGVFDLRPAGVALGPSPLEWFVITGAVTLLFALAAAEGLARRLAGPLSRLVRAARRLERGEDVAAVETSGDEDVATLAGAFSAMALTVRHREDELRRERDLLDGVLDTLAAGVLVLGEAGTVELANPAARRLLGDAPAATALADRFGEGVEAMLAGARGGEGASQVLNLRGIAEALWRVTVVPLAVTQGRLLVLLEDLSEVARAERLASLAELARIVAHEVKNPLTPIRLWAEELQAALAFGPDRVREVASLASEQILERVAHLREVAKGFSNLVAIERWEPRGVSLVELVDKVVDEYRVLEHRDITVEIVARATPHVSADPDWLARALRHLLDNSVRAIGPRPGRIVVTAEESGPSAILAVQDSGGGVREQDLPRLFDPHFSTTSEGSGLGLAVVRRVAERAGGRVEAANREGGLEVRLVLPAAAPGSLC